MSSFTEREALAVDEMVLEPVPQPSGNSRRFWPSLAAPRGVKDMSRHIVDPRRTLHKYMVHLMVCSFIPGPYFMDAMVGAYKTQITADLNIDSATFSLLFALPALTGLLSGPLAPLIERVGCPKVSLMAGTLILASSASFAACYSNSNFMGMLVSRIVFWFGLNVLCTIQSLSLYAIFSASEISIAQGFLIFACRSGGMAGMFFSGHILAIFGGDARSAMWSSVFLVAVALVATMAFAFLRGGTSTVRKVLPLMETRQDSTDSPKPSLREQFHGLTGWTGLLMIGITVTYAIVFPFETISCDFFQERWGLDPSASGMASSLAPFFGLFAWSFGLVIKGTRMQLLFSVMAWCMFLLAYALFYRRQPAENPIPAMCLLGIAYAYQTTCTWVLIPETLRDPRSRTLALSLTMFCMSVGLVASNYLVGVLHDVSGYHAVCKLLFGLAVVGMLSTCVLLGTFPAQGIVEQKVPETGRGRAPSNPIEVVRISRSELSDMQDELSDDYF